MEHLACLPVVPLQMTIMWRAQRDPEEPSGPVPVSKRGEEHKMCWEKSCKNVVLIQESEHEDEQGISVEAAGCTRSPARSVPFSLFDSVRRMQADSWKSTCMLQAVNVHEHFIHLSQYNGNSFQVCEGRAWWKVWMLLWKPNFSFLVCACFQSTVVVLCGEIWPALYSGIQAQKIHVYDQGTRML